jgi:hypothetical protein
MGNERVDPYSGKWTNWPEKELRRQNPKCEINGGGKMEIL